MNLNLLLKCPHCDDFVEITEINCAIFRHGVFKDNLQQINPHLSKIECDNLINNNLIYGCGKPFKIIKKENQNDTYELIICDYI
jgi:hypothetical protein